MESPERELAMVLLDHIRSLGLVSNAAYSGAADLVHSAKDFPDFFQYPALPVKEADTREPVREPG